MLRGRGGGGNFGIWEIIIIINRGGGKLAVQKNRARRGVWWEVGVEDI